MFLRTRRMRKIKCTHIFIYFFSFFCRALSYCFEEGVPLVSSPSGRQDLFRCVPCEQHLKFFLPPLLFFQLDYLFLPLLHVALTELKSSHHSAQIQKMWETWRRERRRRRRKFAPITLMEKWRALHACKERHRRRTRRQEVLVDIFSLKSQIKL